MSSPYHFSQAKFDEMERLIHEMKLYARTKKDNKLWGKADQLGILLRDFVNALIVEGSLPDPSAPRS